MFEITPYRHHEVGYFDPFREFDALERSLFGKHQNSLRTFGTDIRDLGNEYLLEADLPGFDRGDIKVEVNGDCMTIKAERRTSEEKKDKDNNLVYSERSFGSFERRFDISGVNGDAISAEYKDGVLKITMPKKEAKLPEARQLEIK